MMGHPRARNTVPPRSNATFGEHRTELQPSGHDESHEPPCHDPRPTKLNIAERMNSI